MLHPAWSPDGTHIAFSCAGGIWLVGADGSGLTEVIPEGWDPYWSPDGSRIAFELPSGNKIGLGIADADGTNVQTFGSGARAGPWNPLLLSDSDDRGPMAATGGVTLFIYAIAPLGVVGVLVLAWRARRRTGAS